MSTSPNPSRVPRSPSPSLPPPPTSAKLPPRPSASTTQHVPYSRQSLGPGLSSAALPGGLGNPPGSARNFSGPARAVGGGRPVSEILGGGLGVPGGGAAADLRTPEAEAIDRWFQDLASYEVTLEEMAAASLDQNFTEELSAIEQWFRVLSEAERTAALYSLLQHSTQVQIRFFMTVLQQMARSDPMTALLSPAVGGGMQAQMEAKLANLNLRSPNRTSFGGVPPSTTRESFGGGNDHPSSYLTPESALANAGEGPASPAPRSSNASKASHRISAPGTLNSLSPSWAGAGQLDQVLERGPSPSAESVSSARSNGNDVRPKSTDFTGLANGPPGSASFAKSPRLGNGNGNGTGEDVTFPLSPSGAGGNWASMVNTPAVPMFATNHSTIQDHPAFSSLASSVPKLSEAPKRRSSAKMSMGGGNALYNEDGELVGQKTQTSRGLQSPGNVGGGFQGSGAGAWSRSPALGSDQFGGGGAGFPNNFGLGVGGLGGGLAGLGSPSPSDIAFQMSQLQLQQLQLQQLQQLQQLGVANGTGIGMGLPMMAGLGMGMNGPVGLGFGQAPRSASLRSQGAYSPSAAGKRSPMMGMGGNITKSPSPGGRRESSGLGGAGPEEDTDIRVLEDIPQWLRTLRLHKYTPNFEGAKWRDMVLMGDADLEAKGVAALGARRKLLKTFELVRAQYGIAEPAGSTANGAGSENVAVASSASGDDDEFKR